MVGHSPCSDYRARYYDPQLGRFLQTDPIGYEDQMNMYAYVANDPMNFTDPSGEAAVKAAQLGWRAAGLIFKHGLKKGAKKFGEEIAKDTGALFSSNASASTRLAAASNLLLGTWFNTDADTGDAEGSVDPEETGASNSEEKGKKEKAKDRRKRNRQETRAQQGKEDHVEPASESRARHEGRDMTPDERRKLHDAKERGEPDRTKEQLKEDREEILKQRKEKD